MNNQCHNPGLTSIEVTSYKKKYKIIFDINTGMIPWKTIIKCKHETFRCHKDYIYIYKTLNLLFTFNTFTDDFTYI